MELCACASSQLMNRKQEINSILGHVSDKLINCFLFKNNYRKRCVHGISPWLVQNWIDLGLLRVCIMSSVVDAEGRFSF